jgi:3-isopropylmalate/(R)-2-methylmalate dehydratase small subunit
MDKINKIQSSGVPLPIEHIDTDQIIPARFLKSTSKEGFGKNLFRDWRYNGDELNEDFVLNDKKYSGEILVAGHNFGCGSSREHAAWAIHDYGFRAVISSEFADIFKGNAMNNGLLPIEVSTEYLEKLTKAIYNDANTQIHIDLQAQTLEYNGNVFNFEIDSFKKKCLLEGKVAFDYLIEMHSEIEQYEQNRTI